MTPRDKKVLLIGVPVILLILIWNAASGGSGAPDVVASIDNIPAAEKRLSRLKLLSAAVPGKAQALAGIQRELAQREKGLIQAETAAQAQAQLLQTVRKIARELPSPIDVRNTEMGQVKAFGEHYGEVFVAVNFESGIEQLINFLAAVTAQKELVGTSEIRIGSANPKQKTMPVRITLSGLVRKELVPDRKGSSF